MSILLSLMGIAVAIVTALGIRWALACSRANRAVAALKTETRMAEQCQGEVYAVQYQNPGLMFQVLEEVQQMTLALEGSLVLQSLVDRHKRLTWRATRGYDDVVRRAELGIKALNDAAFFAQFPEGAVSIRNVRVNGIPLCER
jgi:hypothetical protein